MVSNSLLDSNFNEEAIDYRDDHLLEKLVRLKTMARHVELVDENGEVVDRMRISLNVLLNSAKNGTRNLKPEKYTPCLTQFEVKVYVVRYNEGILMIDRR
ncbi:hypothetical protein BPAE_0149g00150 [Botrytis paeoniae]|uniref:Uncharacterized protein n=1 Tax=Botrytis paeoniae TaxID=278948 RepID=A0A4Z1FJI1_9HELO|nr:hypothetical protein BPAE_0149g00150 [Botrytis paeoniae]